MIIVFRAGGARNKTGLRAQGCKAQVFTLVARHTKGRNTK